MFPEQGLICYFFAPTPFTFFLPMTGVGGGREFLGRAVHPMGLPNVPVGRSLSWTGPPQSHSTPSPRLFPLHGVLFLPFSARRYPVDLWTQSTINCADELLLDSPSPYLP